MSVVTKLKNRFQNYINYILSENRYKHLFDIEASRLRHDTLTKEDIGVTNESYNLDGNVIVSITTYGKRLYEVYLTIESIMQQTMKANKIILWLSEGLADQALPITLHLQQKRGLEIRYCKELRSYKKLIPALKAFPNDIIITVDDDVVYSHDTLELLVNSYKTNQHCIIANWALEINLNPDGSIAPYRTWKTVKEEGASIRYMPIGCAGILYPPHSLDLEVMNETVFMDICKFGDDIWFKAMALKNGYSCYITPQGIHEHQYLDNPLWQDKGLTLVNVNNNQNDVQIQSVFSLYKLFNAL